uniref:Uncharacterized protein n=1 Tax=Anguilla anguilla TaxID=7936 RepID=A0A0E9QDJ9_ANGAN
MKRHQERTQLTNDAGNTQTLREKHANAA